MIAWLKRKMRLRQIRDEQFEASVQWVFAKSVGNMRRLERLSQVLDELDAEYRALGGK